MLAISSAAENRLKQSRPRFVAQDSLMRYFSKSSFPPSGIALEQGNAAGNAHVALQGHGRRQFPPLGGGRAPGAWDLSDARRGHRRLPQASAVDEALPGEDRRR